MIQFRGQSNCHLAGEIFGYGSKQSLVVGDAHCRTTAIEGQRGTVNHLTTR